MPKEAFMAEAGLFIGWGANVAGREERGLEVFNEAIQFWAQLESDGRIESFEVVLLAPHGGELEGFALLRGTRDQVGALVMDEDFERMNTRAALIVQDLGIVPAVLGDGLGRAIGIYQEELAGAVA
jgi:hypothetical protein